jgi:hypothetical protein
LLIKPQKFRINPDVLIAAGDAAAGAEYKTMKLLIRKVTCLHETNKVSDSDEINMGGTATDPFGNTAQVKEFVVSDDFDKGESVNYGDSKVFHSWDLQTQADHFPYVYTAVIALAEKDVGGFGDFLNKLWKEVGDQVKAAISQALTKAFEALGKAFGILGQIIGAIVAKILDWLIQIFKNPDDPFDPQIVPMTLAAATLSYYAELATPQGYPGTLTFKKDGGIYKVDYAWRIFT